MERCGGRRPFEKPRVEVRPARLQVIGFNVSPGMKAAETAGAAARVLQGLDMVSSPTASYNDQLSPPSLPCSKPASSPRSALQQLLLHQSLASTSPTSSNHSMPPPLPPSISSNQNSINGPLLPATSTPPPAANQKWPSGGLQLQLPPSAASAANQKWTSGALSRPQSPPSAYQSSGLLKSLLQSECSTSDIPTNQSSRTSLSQSQDATSAGNQMINQHNAKPPKAVLIKENYEAFFQIKRTSDDGNDAKAHYELTGGLISSKELINDPLPHAAKSKKSSWLHDDDDDNDDDDDDDDDDQPSAAEKCKKSSWKAVQQITEHSLGSGKSRKNSRSEEKSKKSSLFMFVASSPASDFHHRHHPAEQYDASKGDMDFLSSCHLCRRLLGHGQDVFMYSGDKAFCSMECRYQQIMIDERKERCPPPIIRSGASPVFHHTSVTATTTHHPIMINNPHFINTAAAA